MRKIALLVLVCSSVALAHPKKTKRGVFGENNGFGSGSSLSSSYGVPQQGPGYIPPSTSYGVPNINNGGSNFQPSPAYGPPSPSNGLGFNNVNNGNNFGPGFNNGNNFGPGGNGNFNGEVPIDPSQDTYVGPEYPIGTVDLGKEYRHQHHVHVINKVGIRVARPAPYPVERKVPVKVPKPYDVPVDKPYPVHVPVKVPVKVFKDVHVPVVKHVPIPIEVGHEKVPVHVPVKIYHWKKVHVPVYKQIPVPVPDPVIIKKHVPVAVRTHIEPIHDPHQHWA